ncbi:MULTISPECIES: hypothetical protein [unclassified Paludibacterium]|uniref:hypothetical protein n=1 Tax=unclassified Paludibacterium TaxID=2618429 RepID=UPI001C041AA4|nr:hypothetical protein [Paludibacterium sp. B53371]
MKKILMAFALIASLLACFSWAAQSTPANQAGSASQPHAEASAAMPSADAPAQGDSSVKP